MKADVADPNTDTVIDHVQQDTTVHVSPKGMNALQKYLMENNKPQGGTELQLAYLHKHVDKELLDKVQICTSIPGKIPLSKDKPNILWQKILGINLIYIHGLVNLITINNMIGMYLIVIGTIITL